MLVLGAALSAAPGSSFGFPTTIGGAISDWTLEYGVEMEVWNHTITTAAGHRYATDLSISQTML